MFCLQLFTTAHADQHALCVTLLDLLVLYYFKLSVSPSSLFFVVSIVHALSAPHKPHFRPGLLSVVHTNCLCISQGSLHGGESAGAQRSSSPT